MPFHGVIAKRQKMKYMIFLGSFILTLILALCVGLIPALKKPEGQKRNNGGWFWPFFILVIYFIGVFVANSYLNKQLSYYYRMGHFMLAVFCRVENNRFYLKRGFELRPGYNGMWIEFSRYPTDIDPAKYIQFAKQRFLTPAIEFRQTLFQRQIAENDQVIAEQQKIEAEIKEREKARAQRRSGDEHQRRASEAEIERAEVTAALAEQYNSEFYSNYLNQ